MYYISSVVMLSYSFPLEGDGAHLYREWTGVEEWGSRMGRTQEDTSAFWNPHSFYTLIQKN